MTEKELRRMSRKELIEIIAAMKKAELELQTKLEKAEKQLADRTIRVANAGSIAEAALSLNGVFEAAQAAADTYLQSLHEATADIEARMKQAEEEQTQLLRDAEQEATARIQAADRQCAAMRASTDAEIDKKWETFQRDVQNILQAHSELSGHLREK